MSLNQAVWEAAMKNVESLRKSEIAVMDLGSGILSMLPRVIEMMNSSEYIRSVVYIAIDLDPKLAPCCQETLRSLGFTQVGNSDFILQSQNRKMKLNLVFHDVFKLSKPDVLIDLVIAKCFVDLFDHKTLLADLVRLTPGCLLYAPISFCGETSFSPDSEFDFFVVDAYHKFMSGSGCSIDSRDFAELVSQSGGECLAMGDSSWHVDYSDAQQSYFWQALMAFIVRSVTWNLLPSYHRFHYLEWVIKTRRQKSSLIIGNVDLLLRLPQELSRDLPSVSKVLVHTEPRRVALENKRLGLSSSDVFVQTICSLISTGTELKIFQAQFDSEDVIDSVFDSRQFSYPLEYGYCLVGRITAIGENVSKDYIGKTVFCFRPHVSGFVCRYDEVGMFIPFGIDSSDAVLLPSMETALHLLHEANPLVGDRIAVFGQGLIGLCLSMILSISGFQDHICVDPSRLRANVSEKATSGKCLHPSSNELKSMEFDVCFEVSGNPSGLQSAINLACFGGKVIIGSWYGKNDVSLNLGLEFHRKNLHLITSQVSRIPSSVSSRWTKERRFEYVWKLIRTIQPSRKIPIKALNVVYAQQAFEALESQHHLAVMLTYEDQI
jgi:2-desacetyl-2-hydroxyethyl bacteriochlorophyllide A dehydrogenase